MAEKTEKPAAQKLRDTWINRIEAEDKAHKDARDRAQRVIDRYRDDKRDSGKRMNILWANVNVLKGALYSATPKPDVRRRFLDTDPVSRETAAVIERGIAFSTEAYDFDGTALAALDDYLLAGYGQARVRYKPYFEKVEPYRVPAGPEDKPDCVDESGMPCVTKTERLAYEEVTCEPVQWMNFRWDHTAPRWEDVNWCAIDHYLDRDALKEQFGEIASKIELTHGPQNGKKGEDAKTVALIHEVFDKRKRQVIVVSPGYKDGPVVVWNDPLNLAGFYPFPKPMFATQTTGEIMPIPDFFFYQDQANELDAVTERIDALVEMLKVRGVYDQSFEELVNVLKSGDGDMTPIKDFAARFGDGRDLEKVLAFMPLEEVAKVVAGLYQQRDQLKQTIYELTGISDIVRGQTVASETLGAQQLKGRFADMRLNSRRSVVNSFFRDLFRLKAEIIAEQFSAGTLKLMTGIEVTPQMDQILKSDVLRAYKIDVETESTVAVDAEAEQKSRIEALTALTTFFQAAAPAVQTQMFPAELAKELALFMIRGFKKARSLEDIIERLGAAGQQGGNGQELQQAQQQIQQLTQQLEQGKQYVQELEQKVNAKQIEQQGKAQTEAARIQSDERIAALEASTNKAIAEMNNTTKLLIAHIGGQAKAAEPKPDAA